MDRQGTIRRFSMCAGFMLRRQGVEVDYVIIGAKKIMAPGAKRRGRKAKAA